MSVSKCTPPNPPPKMEDVAWFECGKQPLLFRVKLNTYDILGNHQKLHWDWKWVNGDLEVGPYGCIDGTIAFMMHWSGSEWVKTPLDFISHWPPSGFQFS